MRSAFFLGTFQVAVKSRFFCWQGRFDDNELAWIVSKTLESFEKNFIALADKTENEPDAEVSPQIEHYGIEPDDESTTPRGRGAENPWRPPRREPLIFSIRGLKTAQKNRPKAAFFENHCGATCPAAGIAERTALSITPCHISRKANASLIFSSSYRLGHGSSERPNR